MMKVKIKKPTVWVQGSIIFDMRKMGIFEKNSKIAQQYAK